MATETNTPTTLTAAELAEGRHRQATCTRSYFFMWVTRHADALLTLAAEAMEAKEPRKVNPRAICAGCGHELGIHALLGQCAMPLCICPHPQQQPDQLVTGSGLHPAGHPDHWCESCKGHGTCHAQRPDQLVTGLDLVEHADPLMPHAKGIGTGRLVRTGSERREGWCESCRLGSHGKCILCTCSCTDNKIPPLPSQAHPSPSVSYDTEAPQPGSVLSVPLAHPSPDVGTCIPAGACACVEGSTLLACGHCACQHATSSPDVGALEGVTMTEFEKELTTALNRTSQENASNTPDFILAQFLLGCLAAFNTAVQQRETWCGRDARPSERHV